MLLPLLSVLFPIVVASKEAPSFTIDYSTDSFIRNGQHHRYVSGSVHYFRVPPSLWKDRLTKLRLAGLNTVQTYVEWASHEPQPGVFQWENDLDLKTFITTAQEVGLDVILRPGPFIDAERDFGGLPYWLLWDGEGTIRSKDPRFMARVTAWYTELFNRLQGLFFHQGGPIIMVQVENEYGSYGCDKKYLVDLKDLIINLVGKETVLFTTDGNNIKDVLCGQTAGVYPTVDFGCGTNVTEAFNIQRIFAPRGPLVNSEYYPGWLDHWGHKHSKVDTSCVASTLEEMLQAGASVNIYMFHGGTSFGWGSGSNSPPFQATPTSYDYDAPVTEAGDLTEKWWAIREVVGRYLPLPPLPPNMVNATSKADYGRINMTFISSLFNSLSSLGSPPTLHQTPLSFESLNQSSGLMVYQTVLEGSLPLPSPAVLSIPGLRDRGYVFLNFRLLGVLSREQNIFQLPIQASPGQTLHIVVESQGRVCFGNDLEDRKGILGNVTLGESILYKWTMTGLPLKDGSKLEVLANKVKNSIHQTHQRPSLNHSLSSSLSQSDDSMTVWQGVFTLSRNILTAEDTFLHLPGWTKGTAFINGFNLGRYWPVVGPQITLYIPGVLLHTGGKENILMLVEQENSPCGGEGECSVYMVDTPQIDGPTPY